MITKFKSIKNIGSFFHFEWDSINPSLQVDANGQPILDGSGHQKTINNQFKKLNVLFGENGTGKTTLVKLLKALREDSSSSIQKNWDHDGEACSFEIETDLTPVSFSDTAGIQGNLFKNKILIFDRDYIDSFVHSFPAGRATNHNKNTGSLILYLGNFFQYRTQLNNLSQLRRNLQEKSDQVKSKRDLDFSTLNPASSYEEVKSAFNTIAPAELLDLPGCTKRQQETVENTEKEIKEVNQKIAQADEILKASQPKKVGIVIPVTSGDIDGAFSFSVSTAAAAAMSRVAGREDFIREGIQITHDHGLDECPFCQQSIKEEGEYIDSISQYESIFDATFTSEQDRVRRVLQTYKSNILSLLGFHVPEGNGEAVTKINRLLNQDDHLPDVALSDTEKKTLESELDNIEAKQADITRALSSNIGDVNSVIDGLSGKIDLYNKQVELIEQKLLKAKSDISSGDLPRQKSALEARLSQEVLKLFVCRFHSELSRIFSQEMMIQKNEQTVRKLGELFELLRKKVEDLFKAFVNTYFSEIEKNLSIFCPGLELKIVGTNPRYDLRVGVSGDVTCGLEVHYKNRDRLRDLSEGEKQAIALSYFLAFLNKETNKNEKIIVFDDPINSFDSGRRKQAAELIHKEAINFQQLFVFTCDSLFKSYCLKVSNKRLGDQRNFYYILKSASSAVHYRPKEYQTIYSAFKQDFRNIGTVAGTDDMIVVYGQKLRYCLEEIKDRHLGYSEDKFENILTAVETGRITSLIAKIDEIRELYSYCNTGGLAHFPKDGQTSWNEIKGQIGKYMKLGL